MAISPYVRRLRTHVGSARLLLPSVTALVFNDAGDLLLVRQRDDDVWSTPGGTIEVDEAPADAVVRETWEETGLHVEPIRLAAVHGGREFVVRYPNGDESQYVMTVFECRILGGALRADGEETLEARYWSAVDAATIRMSSWLRHVLPDFHQRDAMPAFTPPHWHPPS